MAIAFDASSSSADTTGTTVTVAHTCTGSNRCLIVCVSSNTSVGTIPTVTYNGVSLTHATTYAVQVPTDRFIFMFFLLAPATGTNNIVATFSGSVPNWGVLAASYTGVGAGSIEVSTTGTATGANDLTTSITTITDNDWLVCCAGASLTSISANSGTAKRVGLNTGVAFLLGDSNGLKTPPGSYSLSVHDDAFAGTNIGMVLVALQPFPLDVTVSATVQSAVFSVQDPTVVGGTDINVLATVQSAVFSVQDPTLSGDSSVIATVQSAVFSTPDPNAGIDIKFGFSKMRSNANQYPLALDIGTTMAEMRNNQNNYPLGMDEDSIL